MNDRVKVHPLGLVLWTVGSVFVAFKLLGVITWPWWAVTVPFWGLLALALAVVVVGVFLVGCVYVAERWARCS